MQFLQIFAKNGSFSSKYSTQSSRFGLDCSFEEPRKLMQVMCMQTDRLTGGKPDFVTTVHQFYMP